MLLRAKIFHDALPADSVVTRLLVREALSQPFAIDCELLCHDPDLDLDALLWSACVFTLHDVEGGTDPRAWHGILEQAEYVARRGDSFAYRLRARPYFHGLAYRVRTRIFQELAVDGIVDKVLSDAGVPADTIQWDPPSLAYATREFCMQWKESELAFVSRLFEDEGIFYWFEHTEATHVLRLADSNAAFSPIDGEPGLVFSTDDQQDREAATDLVLSTQCVSDGYIHRDWAWERAEDVREGEAHDANATGRLVYEYPGGFKDNTTGTRRAQDRMRALTEERNLLEGRTNCRRLAPGRYVNIVGALPETIDGEWLLLSVEHRFTEQATRSDPSAPGHAPPSYRAAFVAVPSVVEHRPARRTPRPRIPGKESAVVTGPAGEEIHVDEFGRIKLHFYFDREGAVDDTATCWVRFQQQNTSGSMILPRVGWEVDVGFIDGDPDRPVVLQKVYNQETMPPYELPGAATQGALQSSTSPGGGSVNEIRLQDGNGSMEWYLHASKDFRCTVGNNMSERIDVDAAEEVGQVLETKVGAAETITVGGNQNVSITQNAKHDTVGSKDVHVGGTDDWGITKNYTVAVNGARKDSIDGLMNVLANKVAENFNASCTRDVGAAFVIISATMIVEAVGGAKTESVGAAKLAIVKNAYAENIGAAKSLLSGAVTWKTGSDYGVGATGALSITSAGPIAEKCGKDWTLTGKQVRVTAPGGIQMKGGGTKFDLKGSKITVNASGFGASGGPQLKLKGKINYQAP